jgi:acetylornithine deacetylase
MASVAKEVIVFGPGDMQTAHSNRECVPLGELDEAVKCLQPLMKTG